MRKILLSVLIVGFLALGAFTLAPAKAKAISLNDINNLFDQVKSLTEEIYSLKSLLGAQVSLTPIRTSLQILPSITLTYPNGGETLTAGQTINITWSSVPAPGAGIASLSLVDPYGNPFMGTDPITGKLATLFNFIPLPQVTISDNGSAFVTIPPDASSGNYQVKICQLDGKCDISDGTFTITSPYAARTLTTTPTLTAVRTPTGAQIGDLATYLPNLALADGARDIRMLVVLTTGAREEVAWRGAPPANLVDWARGGLIGKYTFTYSDQFGWRPWTTYYTVAVAGVVGPTVTATSIIPLQEKVFLLGGVADPDFKLSDVWKSINGINWTQVTSNASWGPRYTHTSLYFKGKIWVLGGTHSTTNNPLNDVWSSPDGVNWTQEVLSAPWAPRAQHASIVFNNKMWVIGGASSSAGVFTYYNDVWSSSDGVNWTQNVSNAPWSGRSSLGVAVFNNKLWVIDGNTAIYPHKGDDVWSSSDGVNWTQNVSNAPWQLGNESHVVAFKNKLWLIDGEDIWSSSNGINWTLATSNAPWGNIWGYTIHTLNNKMWLLAGAGSSAGKTDDVWSSSDGVNWTQEVLSAPWSGRFEHSVVVVPAFLPLLPIEPVRIPALTLAPGVATLSWDSVADAGRYVLNIYRRNFDGSRGVLAGTYRQDVSAGTSLIATDLAAGNYVFYAGAYRADGTWFGWGTSTKFTVGVAAAPTAPATACSQADPAVVISYNGPGPMGPLYPGQQNVTVGRFYLTALCSVNLQSIKFLEMDTSFPVHHPTAIRLYNQSTGVLLGSLSSTNGKYTYTFPSSIAIPAGPGNTLKLELKADLATFQPGVGLYTLGIRHWEADVIDVVTAISIGINKIYGYGSPGDVHTID